MAGAVPVTMPMPIPIHQPQIGWLLLGRQRHFRIGRHAIHQDTQFVPLNLHLAHHQQHLVYRYHLPTLLPGAREKDEINFAIQVFQHGKGHRFALFRRQRAQMADHACQFDRLGVPVGVNIGDSGRSQGGEAG